MFYFFHISILLGNLIKHYKNELYICKKSDGHRSSIRPTSCLKDRATDWKLDFTYDENVKITANNSDDVFNITNMMFLSLFPSHNGPNQIFKIVRLSSNKYHIKNNNHCLEFEPVYNQYIINECKYINRQFFTIIKLNQNAKEPEIIPDKKIWTVNDDSEIKSKYDDKIHKRLFD